MEALRVKDSVNLILSCIQYLSKTTKDLNFENVIHFMSAAWAKKIYALRVILTFCLMKNFL